MFECNTMNPFCGDLQINELAFFTVHNRSRRSSFHGLLLTLFELIHSRLEQNERTCHENWSRYSIRSINSNKVG